MKIKVRQLRHMIAEERVYLQREARDLRGLEPGGRTDIPTLGELEAVEAHISEALEAAWETGVQAFAAELEDAINPVMRRWGSLVEPG